MVNKSSVLAWSADEYSEEGSGTVLALTIIAALLVLTVVIAGLIGVVSANRRASAAADLSALAAADAYRGLTEGDPCAVAVILPNATARSWNLARFRIALKRWR